VSARSHIVQSNSLADLAARIRVEHEATAVSLKQSVEHAIAAGELLLEAKGQLAHGEWLPWLAESCTISERTAQLYMRVAKNRTVIESQIRNDVADLTLNEAVALLALTSNVRQLLDFAKHVEDMHDPEQLIQLCIDEGIGVIRDTGYNPFAGRSDAENREWQTFTLFLVRAQRWTVGSAAAHIEWVLQRPFQNVTEWLGAEGSAFRAKCGMRAVPKAVLRSWQAFFAANEGKTTQEIVGEIEAVARDGAP
jgi:Protein of unknown function (DUF3102)